MRWGWTAVLALAFPIFGSCSNQSERRAATQVRDSAGIAILETGLDGSTATCEAHEAWRVGTAAGAPEYELYRVFDSAEMADGSIAILEGVGRVRVYGPEGEFRYSFGRPGGGPGEFRQSPLVIASLPGDTLVVGDEFPWRFTYFDQAGAYIGSFEPDPPPFRVATVDVLRDGRVLLAVPCCRPQQSRVFAERTITVAVFDRSGSADTVAVLPYDEFGHLDDLSPPFSGRPVFGAVAEVQGRGDTVYYGSGRSPEIRVQDHSGRILRLVRWTPGPPAVVGEDLEAYRRQQKELLGGTGAAGRFLEASLSDSRPVADVFPAFNRFFVGRDGTIWVQLYPLPTAPNGENRDWLVFEPSGQLRCRVTTPSISVHAVGAHFIRGEIKDDLGVEYVVELRLSDSLEPGENGR
jgi:hypothetical protein